MAIKADGFLHGIFQNVDDKKYRENILVKKLAKLGLKSYLAMPLFYNDELIGILEAGSEEPKTDFFRKRNGLNHYKRHH